MKNVLKSLLDFIPGRERAAPEHPAMTETPTITLAPPPEVPPARPPRQRVDPGDIAAAATPDILAEEDAPSQAETSDPALEAEVIEAIKTVRDPEIPVDLVALGLIYDLVVSKQGKVFVEMTLTTPHCPSAADLPRQVEAAALGVPGVTDARVKVVFTPPWHQGLMSEEAKLELGLF